MQSAMKFISLSALLMLQAPFIRADFTGRCVGVTDGSTISVMRGGEAVKIRLEGVVCPEPRQDYGPKAKQFTSDMALGKEVDVKEKDQDRYGRSVGRVTVNGRDLSLELLKAGLAWYDKASSKEKALADAEAEARQAKTGLWSSSNPTPPWDFKKGQDSGDAAAETADQSKAKGDSLGDVIVYVIKDGEEYHRRDCEQLKGEGTPMKLSEAHNNYEPCKTCTPPELPGGDSNELKIK